MRYTSTPISFPLFRVLNLYCFQFEYLYFCYDTNFKGKNLKRFTNGVQRHQLSDKDLYGMSHETKFARMHHQHTSQEVAHG